jgi:hypothetical protein
MALNFGKENKENIWQKGITGKLTGKWHYILEKENKENLWQKGITGKLIGKWH